MYESNTHPVNYHIYRTLHNIIKETDILVIRIV